MLHSKKPRFGGQMKNKFSCQAISRIEGGKSIVSFYSWRKDADVICVDVEVIGLRNYIVIYLSPLTPRVNLWYVYDLTEIIASPTSRIEKVSNLFGRMA